jgi:transcriptional regulator
MGLTEKEVQVLQLRSQGLTQIAVAKRLKISQAAVSDFEKNAHKKLKDAEEMLAFAKSIDVAVRTSPYPVPTKGVRR